MVKIHYILAAIMLAFITSCGEKSKSNDEITEAVQTYAQTNFPNSFLELKEVVLIDTVSNITVAEKALKTVNELSALSEQLEDSLSSMYVDIIAHPSLVKAQNSDSPLAMDIVLNLGELRMNIYSKSSTPEHILEVQDFADTYATLLDAIDATYAKHEGEAKQLRYQILAKNGDADIRLWAFQDVETHHLIIGKNEFTSSDLSKESRTIEETLPKVRAYFLEKNEKNQANLELARKIKKGLEAISL